jgi:hypothetical protein
MARSEAIAAVCRSVTRLMVLPEAVPVALSDAATTLTAVQRKSSSAAPFFGPAEYRTPVTRGLPTPSGSVDVSFLCRLTSSCFLIAHNSVVATCPF